jgi:nucleotide-binding universal stress UspA family protein
MASNWIFPHAVTLAQVFGARLLLNHVMHPNSVNEPERLEDFPRIENYFAAERTPDLPPLKLEVPFEKLYHYNTDIPFVITELAKRREADLICMATTFRERKFPKWIVGKITERVLKKAPCPVYFLRGKSLKETSWKRPRYRNLLLLGDTQPLLPHAQPWLETFKSALHVFPLQPESPDLPPTAKLISVSATERRLPQLLAVIKQTPIDLIITTRQGRSQFSNRLRSDVFVELMRAVDCPILMIR